MKGALFAGASSPHSFPTLHSFPTSHKGTILFHQVRDLAPVRQSMLQGKHAVKASVENPAAPAPASKKGQGAAHLDMAHIQDYAPVPT